jgi:hypothetical protein
LLTINCKTDSDATGLTEDSDAFTGQFRSSVFLIATTDVAAEDVLLDGTPFHNPQIFITKSYCNNFNGLGKAATVVTLKTFTDQQQQICHTCSSVQLQAACHEKS